MSTLMPTPAHPTPPPVNKDGYFGTRRNTDRVANSVNDTSSSQ